MYSLSSGSDGGTLYQLRNAINRKNVVKDPKNNMNACEEFFVHVVDAHILVLAMSEFGISSLEEVPSKFLPLKSCDSLQRRSALLDETRKIVDKYVDIPSSNIIQSADPSTLNNDDHILNYARDLLVSGLFLMIAYVKMME